MTKEEQWIKGSIENYIFAYTGKRAKISDADAQHFTASVMSYLNLGTPSLPSNLDEAANMYGLKSAHGEDNYCAWWHRDGFKAGAEWMARRGVTKNGLVAAYDNGYLRVYTTILDNEDGIKFGDKVIIQIRKK